jgi:hypothetical protein
MKDDENDVDDESTIEGIIDRAIVSVQKTVRR